MCVPIYQKILLLLILASCSATGYKPAYIITDQPRLEEVKTGEHEEGEPLKPTIL
ncbi:MAG: hypothetical protein ACOYK9_00125 [Chlamydiia bacterium]